MPSDPVLEERLKGLSREIAHESELREVTERLTALALEKHAAQQERRLAYVISAVAVVFAALARFLFR